MSAGRDPVGATFWLLEAPDSLAVQSRRDPDGTGLGRYDERGRPHVDKQPIAAYEDRCFAEEARECRSRTFVAHVRFASTGDLSLENTHPFEQHGRLFAHNGVVSDLARLDRELGDARALVRGETDSERLFALITKHTDAAGGDVGVGINRAVRWVAQTLPLYAINLVLINDGELWALRYPDTHDLFVLERRAGGPHADRHLDQASAAGSVRVHSGELATRPAVVLASERMDEDPGWRNLRSGELLHVGPDLTVSTDVILDAPPAHLLTLEDLDPRAAASQQRSPVAATARLVRG